MSQTKAQLIDPVDGTIVNADINASAAIAGSKVSPDFGSQNVVTTGTLGSGALSVNTGTTNTCATFTSTDSGAVINLTDNSARSSIEQNGTDLKIISDTDAGDADSTIKFLVDNSTKMTLDSSGRLAIGTTTEGEADADDLTIAGSANVGITIRSGTSNQGAIYFSDATSGTGEYDGFLGYNQSSRSIFLGSATSTRMTIDQRGHMGLGVVPDDSWPSNGDFRALQIGTGACVFGRGSGDEDRGGIAVNYYHTGSAEKYLANGNASGMLLNDGDVDFFVAAANSSGVDAAMSKTIAMRVAADADIGIGTLDPRAKTEIYDSSVSAAFNATDLTTWRVLQIRNNIESATDTAAGIAFGGDGGSDTETAGICGISTNNTGGIVHLAFLTAEGNASKERMRITSGGTLQVSNGGDGDYAATNPTYHDFTANSASDLILRLRNTNATNPYGLRIIFDNAAPNDSTRYFIQCVDNAAVRFQVNTNGGIQNFQSNDSNLCDEREKKNIVSLETKWDKVKSWELKKFHYNEDADTDTLRYGVIAQQVEEHCPEVLTDWIKQRAEDAVLDEDGNVIKEAVTEIARKGVKEQQMMWMAIKTLQEAQTRIETLETKVAALEAA